jgi:hypothetical protein
MNRLLDDPSWPWFLLRIAVIAAPLLMAGGALLSILR